MKSIEFSINSEQIDRAFRVLYRQQRKTVRLVAHFLTASVLAVLGFWLSGGEAHFIASGRSEEFFSLLVKFVSASLSFGIGGGVAACFWHRHVSVLAQRTVRHWKYRADGKLFAKIDSDHLEIHSRAGSHSLDLCDVEQTIADGENLIFVFNARWGGHFVVCPNNSEVLEALKNAKNHRPTTDSSRKNQILDGQPPPIPELSNQTARDIEFTLAPERMDRAFRTLYKDKLKGIRVVSVYSIAPIATVYTFLSSGNDATPSLPESLFPVFVKVVGGAMSFGIWWALLTFAWNHLVNRHAARVASNWEKVTDGKAMKNRW